MDGKYRVVEKLGKGISQTLATGTLLGCKQYILKMVDEDYKRIITMEPNPLYKPSFDEFQDSLVKQLSEHLGVDKEVLLGRIVREIPDEPPELIQGYTAEQWQEIIDGGYLCEFSFSTDFERVYSSLLDDHGHDEHEGTHYFHPVNDKTNDFQYCRPAQIKGVMRPIFVEPVDDSVMCCFFSGSGFPLHNMRSRCSWGHYKISGDEFSDATSYIEL